MGLPWYVAATVISIAHIDSLKMETQTSAPGEQPKFLGVRWANKSAGKSIDIIQELNSFLYDWPEMRFQVLLTFDCTRLLIVFILDSYV